MKRFILLVLISLSFACLLFSISNQVMVRGGTFQMGDTQGEDTLNGGEKPVHTVTLTYDYFIGKYEVTFDEYDTYCEEIFTSKPKDVGWGRGDRPVINVDWNDAIDYCNWLSEKEGLVKAYDKDGNLLDKRGRQTTDITQVEGYRLPTEAEWEYAARGGHKSIGDYKYAGSNDLKEVGWYWQNSGDRIWGGTDANWNVDILKINNCKTHKVGQKKPNELGLYDMSGNVAEWCHDWYEIYAITSKTNPVGLDNTTKRVLRNGSWGNQSYKSLVAYRRMSPTNTETIRYGFSSFIVGFRVARTLIQENAFKNAGSVYISSIPSGASIYIEDDYKGRTPIAIEGLKIGDCAITLTKDGYEDKTQHLTIQGGKTQNLDINLERTFTDQVLVHGGTFQMGDTHEEKKRVNALPVHTVTLTYDYYIGKYEVTFDEYDTYCAIKGKIPPIDKLNDGRGNNPVNNLTWNDAIDYCNWLSEREGLAKAYDSEGNLLNQNGRQTTDITQVEGYRLPTEAEWEYAARGGHKSIGDYKYAGSNYIEIVAWYRASAGSDALREVGQKQPNELGIYDMSGNVWEICYDKYDDKYYQKSPTENPVNLTGESDYVIRGGAWDEEDIRNRIYFRFSVSPTQKKYNCGFRIARTRYVSPPQNEYTLTIEASPPDGGKVPVGNNYEVGEAVNFSAIANIIPEMVTVLRGTFQMGDEYGYLWSETRPVHTVNLTYDYYIGKTEVTFNAYDTYCEATGKEKPSNYDNWAGYMGRGNKPVINVTWYDAVGYCNWLSEKEGLSKAYDSEGNLLNQNGRQTTDITQVEGYRLPTEAEWEYAARGGHKSIGDYKYAGSNDLKEVGWYWQNSGDRILWGTDDDWDGDTILSNNSKTHEVGQKNPNELGLYDMSGNVWEWCHDWWGSYTDTTKTNPIGQNSGFYRVRRGGSWSGYAKRCRVAYRNSDYPDYSKRYLGIRIARTRK